MLMTAGQTSRAKRTAERRLKQDEELSEAQKMMLFGDNSNAQEDEDMGMY